MHEWLLFKESKQGDCMARAFREYVSLVSVGASHDDCLTCANEITEAIRAWDSGRKNMMVFWRIHSTEQSVRDEYYEKDVIERVWSITSHAFPVVTINFTFNPDAVPETFFQDLETRFRLVNIKSGCSPTKRWNIKGRTTN